MTNQLTEDEQKQLLNLFSEPVLKSGGYPHLYETVAGIYEKAAAKSSYNKSFYWRQAAMFYEMAAGSSLGHNRSERYHAAAKACLKEAA